MGTKVHNNYEDLITFTRASGGHALRPVSYGSELVNNPTFDSDTTGWAKNPDTPSLTLEVDSSRLKITSTAAMGARQDVTTQAGKLYRVEWEYTEGTLSSSNVSVRAYPSGEFTGESNDTPATTGYINFVATGSEARIYLRNDGVGTSFFDNVSVKEVNFDKSDGSLTLYEHPDDVPRVEYDADGNRLGLLVEESRTNLIPSSDADDWTGASGATTSPITETTLGAFTGKTVISQGQTWHRATSGLFSATSGTTYTVTAFYKAGTSGKVYIDFRIPTESSVIKGNVGSLSVSSNAAGTAAILSQETLPQGVYKVVFTVVANATASNCIVGIGANSSTSGETVIALAAQVEQASFGTSYIKTTGSSATRSADTVEISGDVFGLNDKEGTMFIEFDQTYVEGGTGFPRAVELGNDSTSVQRCNIYITESTNRLTAALNTNNVNQGILALNTSLTGTLPMTKVAYGFADNNLGASDNGDTALTDTAADFSGATNKRNQITFGTSSFVGHIKSFKYYPRRLTNAQLEDLSS